MPPASMYNLEQTGKGTGFIKGKHHSGCIALMGIGGKPITARVKVKKELFGYYPPGSQR